MRGGKRGLGGQLGSRGLWKSRGGRRGMRVEHKGNGKGGDRGFGERSFGKDELEGRDHSKLSKTRRLHPGELLLLCHILQVEVSIRTEEFNPAEKLKLVRDGQWRGRQGRF